MRILAKQIKSALIPGLFWALITLFGGYMIDTLNQLKRNDALLHIDISAHRSEMKADLREIKEQVKEIVDYDYNDVAQK